MATTEWAEPDRAAADESCVAGAGKSGRAVLNGNVDWLFQG